MDCLRFWMSASYGQGLFVSCFFSCTIYISSSLFVCYWYSPTSLTSHRDAVRQ